MLLALLLGTGVCSGVVSTELDALEIFVCEGV